MEAPSTELCRLLLKLLHVRQRDRRWTHSASRRDPHLRRGGRRLHFLELLYYERVAIPERKGLEGSHDALGISAHIHWWNTQPIRNNALWPPFWANNNECRVGDQVNVVRVGVQGHGMSQESSKQDVRFDKSQKNKNHTWCHKMSTLSYSSVLSGPKSGASSMSNFHRSSSLWSCSASSAPPLTFISSCVNNDEWGSPFEKTGQVMFRRSKNGLPPLPYRIRTPRGWPG